MCSNTYDCYSPFTFTILTGTSKTRVKNMVTKTFLILMWLQVMTFAMASDICYEIKEVAQFSLHSWWRFVEYSRSSSFVADLSFQEKNQWPPLSYVSPCLTGKGRGTVRWEETFHCCGAARSQMGLSGPPLPMIWPLPLCRLRDITGLIRMTDGTVWQWRGATVHKDPAASALSSLLLSYPSLILLHGKPAAVACGHPRSHREALRQGIDGPANAMWLSHPENASSHPGQAFQSPGRLLTTDLS